MMLTRTSTAECSYARRSRLAQQQAWGRAGLWDKSYHYRQRGRRRLLCWRGPEGEEGDDEATVRILRPILQAENATVDNCSSELLLTRQLGPMTFLDDSAAPSP